MFRLLNGLWNDPSKLHVLDSWSVGSEPVFVG